MKHMRLQKDPRADDDDSRNNYGRWSADGPPSAPVRRRVPPPQLTPPTRPRIVVLPGFYMGFF